jgi:hypothetical protein
MKTPKLHSYLSNVWLRLHDIVDYSHNNHAGEVTAEAWRRDMQHV